MNTPYDGGPAFLSTAKDACHSNEDGMSLRDWFAGQEQLGDFDATACVFPEVLSVALAGPKPEGSWNTNPLAWLKWEADWRAKLRYLRADAMLRAREGGAK